MKLARAIFAELLGTCLFVYLGCGSVVAAKVHASPDIVSIALSFGLSLTVLVWVTAHHSGGHLNPIVSLAMALWGNLSWTMAGGYMLAQIIGAVLGAFLLSIGTNGSVQAATNAVQGNLASAFFMESILSFLLVFVVGETALHPQPHAPLAIGLTVFVAHLVAIPFTGTGINPARSIGPAIVSGTFADLWLFVLAPVVGGLLAAVFVKSVLRIKPRAHEETEMEDIYVEATTTKHHQRSVNQE